MTETRKADVEFFIHATEDKEKVLRAVKDGLNTSKEAEVSKLYGHYGNPILKVKFTFKKGEADELLRRILQKLKEGDRNAVLLDLDASIDDSGRFFIRLDKQELVKGSLRLGKGDPIRIRFSIKGGKEKVKEYVRRFL